MGRLLLVHGKVEQGIGAQKKIVHPEFEAIDPEDQEDQEKVLPIYLRPGGIPLRTMRRWIIEALENYSGYLSAFLPDSLVKKQGLVDLARAMREVHLPEKTADLDALNRFASAAHRAIIFDELFYLQLGIALRRKRRAVENGIAFAGEKKSLTRKMWEMAPSLSRAQEKFCGRFPSTWRRQDVRGACRAT